MSETEIALLASIAANSTRKFYAALNEIKAEIWDESHQHCPSIGCVNPYRAGTLVS